MVNSDDWPRPSEGELPEMYDDIDTMLDVAETELRSHFEIRGDETDRIDFAAATPDDYLAAIDANHEVMVALMQKVAGLPDREFERQYGIGGIGSRLRERKTSFENDEDARTFAEALDDLLPASLALESVLYAFFKTWEVDQRRFYRMRYEDDFREWLAEQGYPNFKGNTLPEEPDFVIPTSEPYEVIGEIRVIQQKDREKRFKEFRSEASEASRNFPDAKFMAIANMGSYIERLEDRELLRDAITRRGTAAIDAVFFHDERDEVLEQLEEWNVSRQMTFN